MIASGTERDRAQGYLPGFGNHVSTEAVTGALPVGRNSPQVTPFGLYAEQISGSAFTAPRQESRRSWLYRLRPTAAHGRYRPYERTGRLGYAACAPGPPTPNRLRWDPLPLPSEPADFVDGLVTFAANGTVDGPGVGVHLYAANRSMEDRVFVSADGELLLVPQSGRLKLVTEFGVLDLAPGWIGVVPRGVRFRAELPEGAARGYVCENFGAPLRLPELGPIGSNGLANPRDFEHPVAAYEDVESPFEVVQKFQGALWTTTLDHSPLDVVAWHGTLAPYRYDLLRFNAVNTVSFDHPDPSIFTVLTSPSDTPGVANCDFVVFPPRWTVAEGTFRPPWFHRNIMSEFMGLISGAYDAKAEGFAPGGASLHNCMSAHGPDLASYREGVRAELKPSKLDNGLAFMFESRWSFRPSRFALETELLQPDYDACWSGFAKAQAPDDHRP